MITNRRTRVIAIAGAAALALAGCSTDDAEDVVNEATSAGASATSEAKDAVDAQNQEVTLEDGYIKEKPADKDMTAIFGTLVNNTDEDLEITDFYVEGLSADTVYEQHEVADGVMREIKGGHVIPANGSHELLPGGDHLMIMNNFDDLAPGAEYTLVINFDDGSELSIDIPVRVQPAGEEDYAGSAEG
ncbi:copper chaperone PCu(A)C [Corynebacterium sp. TAE3-ERU12]|uniref:copper chaperone PCu(A)C n=1 Tax=Corynebacterium sp. TAE3-ERU12 TaxID=2849491 RepID=UPI001C476D33|nr:copper chaperone PCu(A)C [Corynebacterium sp. TAE3-ERU12]MBV7295342.1 copper chaperone PCu(A)C [Corynebacterium sp. TAE3-ERU12]